MLKVNSRMHRVWLRMNPLKTYSGREIRDMALELGSPANPKPAAS